MSNMLLQARGLCKHFNQVTAVDNVTIDFANQEFFALLGPSGCGKTTLLRMLAGFESPSAGQILLENKDITNLAPAQRPLNLMFQTYALFPHMSVWQNIAYGLEMENCSKIEIQQRVGEIIEMTLLTEYTQRKPSQLSGGQRQRVALARALVKRPRMLLLDEPLAALDKQLRTQMQLELKRMQHEIGITFLVVTHDQEEALVMADRVAVMNKGRVEQLAAPQTLYERPGNRFVAGFIGAMNFIPGRVVKDGIDVDRLGLIKAQVSDMTIGDDAWLTIRPERIVLTIDKPADVCGVLKAKVFDTAYLGQDLKVHLKSVTANIDIEVRVTSTDAERDCFTPGQTLWCSWPLNQACVLAH